MEQRVPCGQHCPGEQGEEVGWMCRDHREGKDMYTTKTSTRKWSCRVLDYVLHSVYYKHLKLTQLLYNDWPIVAIEPVSAGGHCSGGQAAGGEIKVTPCAAYLTKPM